MPHLPSASQAASTAIRRSKLSKSQQDKLEKHAGHHSDAHMDMMLDLMFKGVSFEKAHAMVMKKVGE